MFFSEFYGTMFVYKLVVKGGAFMGSDYQKQYQKEHENLLLEVDDLKKLIKNLASTISTLNDTINAMNFVSEKKDAYP